MRLRIKSDFLIIDVKQGRHALEKHFRARPDRGACPKELRVPVTITGYIDGVFGNDDGVSREFTVTVESVET